MTTVFIKGSEVQRILGVNRGVVEKLVRDELLVVERARGNRVTGYSLESVEALQHEGGCLISGKQAQELLGVGKTVLWRMVQRNEVVVQRRYGSRITGYDYESVLEAKKRRQIQSCKICAVDISYKSETGLCRSCYKKKHREENKEHYNRRARINRKARRASDHQRHKERYANDLNFRLQILLRSRLHRALNGKAKIGSALRELGCSFQELRQHLEMQFEPGMTWDNHGRTGWHIDHIIPMASFDLTDPEQFRRCCHYTNLQPLWAEDNMKKGAKIL